MVSRLRPAEVNTLLSVEFVQFSDRRLPLPDEFIGTPGDDQLSGVKAGRNLIRGLGGNDTINVVAGFGEVYGDDGNDIINAGATSDDRAYGGNGNDTINGQGGNDLLWGEAGNDLIQGGAGNDTLDGGDGDDELRGGVGDDVLHSGSGNDRLFGEDGNDVVHLQVGSKSVDGGLGADTAVVTGISTDYDLTSTAEGWRLVRRSRPTEFISLVNTETVQFDDRRVVFDELIGTPGDDALNGTKAGRNVIRGLAGNDTIKVTAGFGEIYAGDGNDVVHAGVWSDDTAYGGSGNDQLNGQWGNDTLFGEAGDDFINGGAGNDTLEGGDGNDRIYGDYGNDTLRGGNGNDSLYPQLGVNVVDGGADSDRLFLPGLYADFEILVESDGRIAVSHVESIVSATVTNVELLVFQDGSYDVQTGEFSLNPPTPPSGPAPPATPIETVVPQSIVDSMVDVSAIQNAIVAVKVQKHARDGCRFRIRYLRARIQTGRLGIGLNCRSSFWRSIPRDANGCYHPL